MADKIHERIGGGRSHFFFWCPGCNDPHGFNDSWKFDRNFESPTIHPSILVTTPGHPDPAYGIPPYRCHSYIKDGRIEFLSDCTHESAGMTLDLPDYPDSYK